MARPTLELRGVRELRNNLRRVGVDLGENLKPAMREAASIVAVRARTLVPVKSGALRDTIGPGVTKRGAIVRAGFRSVPYARPVNYGSPARNIPGVHFMYNAAKSTETQWVEVVERGFAEEIDKITRGVG